MSTTSPNYIAVEPNGAAHPVPPTYDGIKQGLHDKHFDVVACYPGDHFLYLDDEGMLNGSLLNVPGSIMAGRPIYGPVVLTGGIDDAGDTMLPELAVANHLMTLAHYWRHVVTEADALGQSLDVVANPARIPAPEIQMLTDAQLDAFLAGKREQS